MPPRIRVGSHRDAAGVLGEEHLDHVFAAALLDEASRHRPIAHATGRPGDMYVCHPFCVHAAQEHHGTNPRFMAQMPIVLSEPLGPNSPTLPARSVWQD